ncbi:MAG TPA: cation diffusion facilitator family transporter [Pyrinomonadaceae bacterium]
MATEASVEIHLSRAKREARFHGGAHMHGRAARSRHRLSLVLGLTAIYMLAEALGGWWTGSLALLADAGHMLADVAALGLALLAVWFGSRPATPSKTFGYYRLEILAAWMNGVALVIIALLICYEAYGRWSQPPEVRSGLMLLLATGGLFVNIACAWLLHGERRHDLNMRGVWLHVIGDTLGSIGAMVAGALMWLYGWRAADPLMSVLIGALIVWSSWKLIHESTNVLLEGTPAHINLAAVEGVILQTGGVQDVHDLHVWTITSGREALSAHVIHAEHISQPELLKELRAKLSDKFGIDHLTIQMETPDYEDETLHFCHTGIACFRSERD